MKDPTVACLMVPGALTNCLLASLAPLASVCAASSLVLLPEDRCIGIGIGIGVW